VFFVRAEAPAGLYDGFGVSARNIALAGLAGAAALAALLALKASSSVTEPVLRMAASMRLVEAGDLSIRIAPSGDDELGDLARSFNAMTAEIAALLKDEVERQELLRESELRALAAQMNPHFLHNTLASIKSLAKLGRADEIALVVSRLGKILRAGVNRRDGRSTIGDGLEFVRDYLSIEKVRFGDRFEFVIDVPKEMEAISLPPLSLEPLAENALTHGLERKRGKGRLAVRGRLEGGDAVVSFEDDGPGMEEEALEELRRSLGSDEAPSGEHGMGLLGTNRRLALEFGRGYGLSLGLPASGFRVELRVPAGAARAGAAT
jgi:two-component system sensor histidine kinase YesM